MSEYHPLTQSILALVDNDGLSVHSDEVDAVVRGYVTPAATVVESGVRFPDMPDVLVNVAGNFIASGNQMQMVLIGTEPVLVIQPEYDIDTNEVTLITTAVDLPPAGLIHVLEALIDGTREIVRIQTAQEAEQSEADAALRAASDEFDALAEPPC